VRSSAGRPRRDCRSRLPSARALAAARRLHGVVPPLLPDDAEHHHDREDRPTRRPCSRRVRGRLPRAGDGGFLRLETGGHLERRRFAGNGATLDLDARPGKEPPGIPGGGRKRRARRRGHPARSARSGTPGRGAGPRADPAPRRGGVRGQLPAGSGGPHGPGRDRTSARGLALRAAQADRNAHPQRPAGRAPAPSGRDARDRAEPELVAAGLRGD